VQGWQPAVATAPTPTPDIVEIDLELAIPGVVSLYVFLQAGQIVGVDSELAASRAVLAICQPLAVVDCYLLRGCDVKWSWHEAQIWALPGCS
jgi:hypothetical protein